MGPTLQLRGAQYGGPAIFAAMAFVAIQIGIGLIFKHVQRTEGRHAFSQSSALAISELIKFCLSTLLVYRRWSLSLSQDGSYQPRSTSHDTECEAQSKTAASRVDSPISWSLSNVRKPPLDSAESSLPHTKPNTFIASILRGLSLREAYGMAYLALLYAIMNNTVFLLYRQVHPSTISFVHAAMTIFTALSLCMTNGRTITKRQWVALLLQICCCISAHHRPGNRSLYPLSTYILLMFQSMVSAGAGLYSRHLLSTSMGSSGECKMALYGAGTVINVAVHAATRFTVATEPGFFHGYRSWDATMLVASNILIGLALTTAYKYSQAVSQNISMSAFAGVLLYSGAYLLHLPISFVILPGTVTVFAGTWLYIDSATKSDLGNISDSLRRRASNSSKVGTLRRLWPGGSPGLGLAATTTVALIVWLDQSSIGYPS